jgi:hypothetical protein
VFYVAPSATETQGPNVPLHSAVLKWHKFSLGSPARPSPRAAIDIM